MLYPCVLGDLARIAVGAFPRKMPVRESDTLKMT